MEYEIIEIAIGDTASEYIMGTFEDGKKIGIPADPANSDYQAYLTWVEENK